MMLKGIHLGKVAAKQFLNIGVIGVVSISLLTLLALLNKTPCCTESRLQCFSGNSAVWGKLLVTPISTIFFHDNHMIMLDFHRGMAHRISLCNCVRFIGGTLVDRVAHGNWQIQGRSLKVQNQLTRYVVGFVNLLFWWRDQRSKVVLNFEYLESL